MLVALGFLLACLIVVALLPAYGARAVRLTTQRIRQSLPLSEDEIRADKDRIRAEYAIRIHKLEARSEQAKLAAARQQVEINRRDAALSALERDVERLTAALEEHQNARRVLEQLVTDRVPVEARTHLDPHDGEVAAIDTDTVKSVRAFDEAAQINAQQRAEIDRLNAALATRAAHNREALSDPKFDGEVALRSEIGALRARTRDQANIIARLQAMIHATGGPQEAPDAEGTALYGGPTSRGADGHLERSQWDLADAEAVLKAVRDRAAARAASHAALEAQIQTLRTTGEERASTIKRLETSLAASKADGAGSDGQSELIQRLHAELAAANERLALQSAQFKDEMRRLPASGPARRSGAATAKRSLAERISQAVPELAASSPARLAKGPTTAPQASPPAAPANPTGVQSAHAAHQQPASLSGRHAAANRTSAAREAADHTRAEPKLKPRLLDRISSIDKS